MLSRDSLCLCSGGLTAMMWPFPTLPPSAPGGAVPLNPVRRTICQEMFAHDQQRNVNPQALLNRVVFDSIVPYADAVGALRLHPCPSIRWCTAIVRVTKHIASIVKVTCVVPVGAGLVEPLGCDDAARQGRGPHCWLWVG
jgi:hypothetical protein